MASDELVQRIQERSRSEGPEEARERTGKTELGEQRHASAAVAGNRCAVAKHEPPTLTAGFFGDGREELSGLAIGEREEGQLFMAVEPGDDPRRPAAKLSAA